MHNSISQQMDCGYIFAEIWIKTSFSLTRKKLKEKMVKCIALKKNLIRHFSINIKFPKVVKVRNKM